MWTGVPSWWGPASTGPSGASGVVRRHWVFGLLLAAGLVLRVVAQVGYEPALLFIDSKKYIFGTDFTNATGDRSTRSATRCWSCARC